MCLHLHNHQLLITAIVYILTTVKLQVKRRHRSLVILTELSASTGGVGLHFISRIIR